MSADAARCDSVNQAQSSLRQALAYFPKPAGAAGTPTAQALSVPPPHVAPGGPLPGYTPREQLQVIVGNLRERQLKGPWRSAHSASQQPKRAGNMAGSMVASAAENINHNGSQVSSDVSIDSSCRGSQISTAYAGSSSSLANSFTGQLGTGIACSEAAAPEGLSSLGARLHMHGQCTPCKFIRSLRGCRDGSMCMLCHEPHEELSRSGVRKAARTKALQRRAMIELAQGSAAAAAAAVPERLPQTMALDYEQISAAPWLRNNFHYAPVPGRAPSASSFSTSVPGSGASSSYGLSDGPSSYCQVFSL